MSKKVKIEAIPDTESEITPEVQETVQETAEEYTETNELSKVYVKYKTLSSGPEGTIYPGTVVEVSEDEAKELIIGGYVDGV